MNMQCYGMFKVDGDNDSNLILVDTVMITYKNYLCLYRQLDDTAFAELRGACGAISILFDPRKNMIKCLVCPKFIN